jgi:hypothetical protein
VANLHGELHQPPSVFVKYWIFRPHGALPNAKQCSRVETCAAYIIDSRVDTFPPRYPIIFPDQMLSYKYLVTLVEQTGERDEIKWFQ